MLRSMQDKYLIAILSLYALHHLVIEKATKNDDLCITIKKNRIKDIAMAAFAMARAFLYATKKTYQYFTSELKRCAYI
jgi:hypothetical protein